MTLSNRQAIFARRTNTSLRSEPSRRSINVLGFFPDPYPDELIYSACARYSDRMRFPSKSCAVREWFGKNATAVVDLPGRLRILISQLPPGHHYNLDRLLEKHTLLPFYSPFIPPKRLQDAKQDMQNPGANR